MRLSASSVAYWPRFHVGFSTVHCVFLSVAVSVQKKLSLGSPPPRANVSTWMSPGGTRQAMISSPEWQGMAFFSGLLRPELPLHFVTPGLIRGSPLSIRPMVLSLMVRMADSTGGAMLATYCSYSSTQRSISALKYGVQGHPASRQIAASTGLASSS